MDLSKLAGALLSGKSVDTISQMSGSGKTDVKSVIAAAVPMFLQNGAKASEDDLQKAAKSGVTGVITAMLGKNASSTIARSTGVTTKSTGNILNVVAPLLLNLLTGKNDSEASSGSGAASLLGGLLGGSSSGNSSSGLGSLLGGLLGGSSKPEQSAASSNDGASSLLSTIMGLVSTDTSGEK